MKCVQLLVGAAAVAFCLIGTAAQASASTPYAITHVYQWTSDPGGPKCTNFIDLEDDYGHSHLLRKPCDAAVWTDEGWKSYAPPADTLQRPFWYDSNGNVYFNADSGSGGFIGIGTDPDHRSWDPNGSDVIEIAVDVVSYMSGSILE